MSTLLRLSPERSKARAAQALLGAMSVAGMPGLFFCAQCGMVSVIDGGAASCPHPRLARHDLERMSVPDLFAFWQMVQAMIDLGALSFEL